MEWNRIEYDQVMHTGCASIIVGESYTEASATMYTQDPTSELRKRCVACVVKCKFYPQISFTSLYKEFVCAWPSGHPGPHP
jgi:hypothetical protein